MADGSIFASDYYHFTCPQGCFLHLFFNHLGVDIPVLFFSPGIGPHLAEESSLFSLVLFSKVSQEVET